jgi:hypothetical protein
LIQSSVWKATSTPACSSTAPLCGSKSAASILPPGVSIMISETGTPAARDLGRHLGRLAGVVEHDAEAELLLQPEHGEDVVVPVGVVLRRCACPRGPR